MREVGRVVPVEAASARSLAEMMAADREAEERPFGGFAGEMAPERAAPAPPPPPPLVIPPPPWAENGEREAEPPEIVVGEPLELSEAQPPDLPVTSATIGGASSGRSAT
jgi:hypothetical protein